MYNANALSSSAHSSIHSNHHSAINSPGAGGGIGGKVVRKEKRGCSTSSEEHSKYEDHEYIQSSSSPNARIVDSVDAANTLTRSPPFDPMSGNAMEDIPSSLAMYATNNYIGGSNDHVSNNPLSSPVHVDTLFDLSSWNNASSPEGTKKRKEEEGTTSSGSGASTNGAMGKTSSTTTGTKRALEPPKALERSTSSSSATNGNKRRPTLNRSASSSATFGGFPPPPNFLRNISTSSMDSGLELLLAAAGSMEGNP
jgi:hypothetical protein